jgi:hypothetical protein
MHSVARVPLLLTGLLYIIPVVLASPRVCPANSSGGQAVAAGKAIYFLTNDQENAVVAVPIAADGTLSAGSLTATGGAGSNSIDGSTGQPAVPDPLVSQSSLTIAGNVGLPIFYRCPRLIANTRRRTSSLSTPAPTHSRC